MMDIANMLVERSTPVYIENSPAISKKLVLGVTWPLAAIAFIALILRLFVRLRKFKTFYLDDYFAMFALVISFALAGCNTVNLNIMLYLLEVQAGKVPFTHHSLVEISRYYKLQLAISLLFWTALWSIKLSFLLFFHRLSGRERRHEILWWSVLGFTILAYIASCITFPIYCHKFAYGQCEDSLSIFRALVSLRFSTAMDIITDLLIIAVPIHLLRNVQIPPKKKLALLAVLCSGFLIVITCIIRIVVLNSKTKLPQPIWLGLWTSIELSVALTVCNLTSFRSFFTKNEASYYSNSGGAPGYTSNRSKGASGFNKPTTNSSLNQPPTVYANQRSGQAITAVSSPGSSDLWKSPDVSASDRRDSDEDLFRGTGVYVKHEFGMSP